MTVFKRINSTLNIMAKLFSLIKYGCGKWMIAMHFGYHAVNNN